MKGDYAKNIWNLFVCVAFCWIVHHNKYRNRNFTGSWNFWRGCYSGSEYLLWVSFNGEMMKTIAERVAELPEEERELHKDLIEECLKRESVLEETRKQQEKGLKALTDNQILLRSVDGTQRGNNYHSHTQRS
jgi:hypothetical protein